MKAIRLHVAALPLVLMAAAIAASGCASAGRRPSAVRTPGVGRDVAVTIENQNFKDADVYAVWSTGARDRLGMSTGNTTSTFTAPYRPGDMRIEVDFIAGDDVVSDAIAVNQGDHVQIQIPPDVE